MAKWYSSFLVRWWRLGSGHQRIEIEHIQTGERALLDSLRAAFNWIDALGDGPAHAPGSTPDQVDPAPGSNGDAESSR